MLRTFLVEDEIVVRETIKKMIPWEQYGYELVGEAPDGEVALPMIKNLKPDLLITDIKMPFMDGLELSRLVKKALTDIKIVILSGYNEFDYAKEAIKMGISDYILKPVTSAALVEALKRVADTIREEREREKLLERYFASYKKYTEFLDQTDYRGVDRRLIEEFLKLGSVDECETFVEEYFAAVGENNYKSLLLRQYMVVDIFYCVQEFVRNLGIEEELPESFRDIKRIPQAITEVEKTKHYLVGLFGCALEVRDRVSSDRYGQVIREAKSFIKENFSRGDFSLNLVAAHIGVSPSYFSSIFRQETGQTFVEYLTRVRIDSACEMLKCTNLRTAEIGERAGYNDPHYFSSAFKKVMGMSPKEYKTSVRQG